MGSDHDFNFLPIPGATGLQSSGNSLQLESFEFPPIAAKCIKIQGHGNTSNIWNSFTEVAIFANSNVELPSNPQWIDDNHVSSNRMLSYHEAHHAVDGSLDSRWSCLGDCSLNVELEAETLVTDVTVAWYRGDERTVDFALESSIDGIAWTERTVTASLKPTLEAQSLELVPFFARILYIGNGNSQNDWNTILEFEVYSDF